MITLVSVLLQIHRDECLRKIPDIDAFPFKNQAYNIEKHFGVRKFTFIFF